jgi:hypothetical protein
METMHLRQGNIRDSKRLICCYGVKYVATATGWGSNDVGKDCVFFSEIIFFPAELELGDGNRNI